MQLTKRMSQSSQLGLSYTWSKAISWADNNDSGLTWQAPALWRRNRAVANFDRPQNLQIFRVSTNCPSARARSTPPAAWRGSTRRLAVERHLQRLQRLAVHRSLRRARR
jgi:hypothetical protein